MKNLSFLAAFLLVALSASAQPLSDTIPVYKRFPELPQFTIMRLPDSTRFTREDLPRKKPSIIMLFSPDCEHCKHAMHDLLAKYDEWKNAELVLVSSLDFEHIRKFYDEYQLSKYPNIVIGRDGSFYLGSFYKIRSYPSLYVYDKKQKLVTEFLGKINPDDLLKVLN
ncbi:MAG: redoxin domain-containing protein [Chitinophagaceae bacterium]|nr:redoxin domain-containing protein [Bacteroidota bacterium]MCC6257159.1 redoxin domain-containing protein [Chitinophagaceae bacterium]